MATPAQIDAQVQFERDAIAQGLQRLHNDTRKLEQKQYASASVYGVASIDSLLPRVTERIENTTNRIHEGYTGKSFREIKEYLSDVEALAAAAIALKITFDKVFAVKKDSDRLINVVDSIGLAVEQECQMRYYERACPGLLKTIKDNYWHRACGTQQKLVVVRTLINRSDTDPWNAWARPVRVKLGTWLLSCIMEASGWFTKDYTYVHGKKDQRVVPTPEFMAIKDEVMANAELFSPIAYPMLIEPNDWTNERAGGYLLNEVMRGHDMVRRGASCIQGETPIDFLNKIQKVGYALNPFTIMVADHCLKNGISVGKFIPVVEYDLPNKPFDIDTNKEARQGYKRECAEVYNKRADSFRRSCRTRMTMQAVDLFRDKDEFFIPWSFDYQRTSLSYPCFLNTSRYRLWKESASFLTRSDDDTICRGLVSFSGSHNIWS